MIPSMTGPKFGFQVPNRLFSIFLSLLGRLHDTCIRFYHFNVWRRLRRAMRVWLINFEPLSVTVITYLIPSYM